MKRSKRIVPRPAPISSRISAHSRALCARSSALGSGRSARTLANSPQIGCNRRMGTEHPVVLVTGAAKRVGAQIARTLHAAGFDLALHYRRSHGEMATLCAELESSRAN